MTRRQTPEFNRNRKQILAGNPTCHWCKRAPATDADHLIPFDAGGSDNLDNLVPACKRCNSIRGAKHLNQKRAAQQQARDEHIRANGFFATQTHTTPTLSPNIQQTAEHSPALDWVPDVSVGSGRALPRLATPVAGYESYGGLICDFAEARLGRVLFDWQRAALDGAFAHDGTGKFVHSTALISSGRQNGKTTMLTAVVAWCLLELPRIWGRPVRIMSTAHELALATEVFEELRDLFELIEESDLGKVTWAYGRHQVRMKDGSVYAVKAASSRKHGGTWDIICADEIWAISEETIFGAFRPSQIAVPSPLMFCTSTAGDESSRAFLKWREQALAIIDSGQPSDLFMAEWSLPNVDPLDERWWGYANPAMGKTITLEGLRSAAAAPDRAQFLRAHCNLWVAAAQSWMPPGRWETCRTDLDDGDGGIIAVDSAVDDSKYVGVWCRTNTQGEIVAHVEFATESIATMWAEIARVLDQDPKVKLAITPSLDLHTPERYQRRKQVWGYAELLKYTGTVRNLILEDRVKWAGGGEMLGEHVNRAVLTKAQGSVVISSQRSPGPIECARCLIAAAAFVSRPGQTSKPSMGSAR